MKLNSVPEVGLGLCVLVAVDGLSDVLREDLVEDVVGGHGEGRLLLKQPLDEQGVEVARVHHVVLAPAKENIFGG